MMRFGGKINILNIYRLADGSNTALVLSYLGTLILPYPGTNIPVAWYLYYHTLPLILPYPGTNPGTNTLVLLPLYPGSNTLVPRH